MMARKSKSKLLKNSLKQAELTRARFSHIPYPSRIHQTDEKLSFTTRSGEKFRSKLTKLSVNKQWSLVKKEWIIVKQVQLCKSSEKCLCGRPNLKHVIHLKNKTNSNETIAGNCCILTLQ